MFPSTPPQSDLLWTALILLLALPGAVGWWLGIVAFVRTRRLQAEIRALRQERAGVAGAMAPGETMAGAAGPVMAVATGTGAMPGPGPEVPFAPVGMPASARAGWRDLETALTQRWGMWLGAVALLLSGVFLVRYAADAGWLTAPVRCLGLGALGGALVGGAEWLRRRPGAARETEDLAPAALVAGGLSMLFAGAYAAGSVYRLVPPAAGFALVALVSLAALPLSLRFGRLVAAIGLAGAFATPALVQDGLASTPALFGYLLLVTLSGLALQRRTGWAWLGWATLLAGGAWVGVAALPGDGGRMAWAPALFAPLSALLHLAGRWGADGSDAGGRRRGEASIAVPGIALLLAASDGFMPMQAVGLLLLSPVALGVAWRRPALDRLPWLAGGAMLLLLALWTWPGWLGGTRGSGATVPVAAAASAMLLSLAGLVRGRAVGGARSGWTGLPAVLPGLVLALWHLGSAPVGQSPWIVAAVLLAVALVVAAQVAVSRQQAGILLAGAAGAAGLGLGWGLGALGAPFRMAQPELAGLSPLLPVLGLLWRWAGVAALRQVALLVAVGLLAWPFVTLPGLSAWVGPEGLDRLPSLAVVAGCFAGAAAAFAVARRDGLARLLQGGSVLLLAWLVAVAVRVSGLEPDGFGAAALQVAGVWLEGLLWLWLWRRQVAGFGGIWGWRLVGAAAVAGSLVLMARSPLVWPVPVGRLMLLDWLLPAYAVPALAAVLAGRWLRDAEWASGPAFGRRSGTQSAGEAGPGPGSRLEGGHGWVSWFALLSGFVWISLEVRHLFHVGRMDWPAVGVDEAELWALSGAWLVLAILLMATGLVRKRAGPRRAGLLVLVVTALKVVVLDTSGLAGLWRVLSFLALGLTSIGLGVATRRFGSETLSRPDVAAARKPEEIS